MGKSGESFWDTAICRRALNRWALKARDAGTAKLSLLRQQLRHAQQLRRHLDRLIHIADTRLARPAGLAHPPSADWAWRPDLWRGRLAEPGLVSPDSKAMLGSEVTIFHDGAQPEFTVRQTRNLHAEDLAPYGLRIDVFHFDGTFLSAVLDLPREATLGLGRTHILRLSTHIELERPMQAFARLNIRHGPNVEKLVRALDPGRQTVDVEFDLAYSGLNEKRVETAWIDLIFEEPEMTLITLRDLTFSRRKRAQL